MPARAITIARPAGSIAPTARRGRRGGLVVAVVLALAVFASAPAALAAPANIFTVAGATQGLSGDGAAATAAQLDNPSGVAVTADGAT